VKRQHAALIVIGLAMLGGGLVESFDGKYAILCVSAVSLGFLHSLP
jgi:hypothetical protein